VRKLATVVALSFAACSAATASPPGAADASAESDGPGSSPEGGADSGAPDATSGAPGDAARDVREEPGGDAGDDADGAASTDGGVTACHTTLTYGAAWIHGAGHPGSSDEVAGSVTWDGTCTDDGANSYALLSNGFKPYFAGDAACIIALDSVGCPDVAPGCATRITYGSSWERTASHPLDYDDVADRVLWDGVCSTDGAGAAFATLSNGWAPHFSSDASSAACAMSLRYTQCGGLYTNPVVPVDCADPGVLHDGARYVVACTSGDAADAFPLRTSSDLIAWSEAGSIFPSASKPSWAKSDFWAPEVHRVGSAYVAYFTARHSDGVLSVGAATAPSALGPFADVGAPLVHQASMGSIDPHEFQAPDGTLYLLWKDDGNAVGMPTPIHIQPLSADGITLMGAPTTLITNDQPWEGAVTEAPWLVTHGGEFFLFYSGGSYADSTYAVGVARASSPLGPFTKAGSPLVATKGNWVGPGHCSIVDAPSGDLAIVEHGWATGHVNGPGDGRLLLVDRVAWAATGWPSTIAPSTGSVAVP
jgi:GH43 family beta-xylosidase